VIVPHEIKKLNVIQKIYKLEMDGLEYSSPFATIVEGYAKITALLST